MKAVLGLGANLGDAEGNLRRALECIDSLCNTQLLRVSNFYATEAVEVKELQPPYINCVAEIKTNLSPHALLGACLGIESALGRVRTGYKSPRTVDIDLLIYENCSEESHELTLPHPRMMYRAFVLVPLKDLYPEGNALGVEFLSKMSGVSDQQIALHKKK